MALNLEGLFLSAFNHQSSLAEPSKWVSRDLVRLTAVEGRFTMVPLLPPAHSVSLEAPFVGSEPVTPPSEN